MNNYRTLQVLVSTMNQTDHSLLERMRIDSDAVVVNQCNKNSKEVLEYGDNIVIWINSDERGVSRSRNMAIRNANAEICLLCDDDEKLYENYKNAIIHAYEEQNDADLIVFNVNRIGWNEEERKFQSIEKVAAYKTYSSVHLSFKRQSIIDSKICFNPYFGAGSGKYSCAEDALFCINSHRNGLRMYKYPKTIAEVTCENSTWFDGYNEKFFFDTGAFLSEAFPHMKHILKLYYPLRCRNISSLSALEILKSLNSGMKGYKYGMSHAEYCGYLVNKEHSCNS